MLHYFPTVRDSNIFINATMFIARDDAFRLRYSGDYNKAKHDALWQVKYALAVFQKASQYADSGRNVYLYGSDLFPFMCTFAKPNADNIEDVYSAELVSKLLQSMSKAPSPVKVFLHPDDEEGDYALLADLASRTDMIDLHIYRPCRLDRVNAADYGGKAYAVRYGTFQYAKQNATTKKARAALRSAVWLVD